ncbi:MFS general substrate transporter [Xylona heveae TC161]|uniref:MFS general substrate transporter n=1 Tax=Xylona heveae (strain CBS 132557 / TC161) TaxID=1328760 RepID=A0A165IJM6_XYLHT|nr:MFS general substrate transporter [Xylona heveae TC161]KZF24988.1 MFS general substrate transporter [Xylona heveae TC161]
MVRRIFSVTPVQAATYLIGVCLFSISFLVFLNSSVSFVITNRIKLHHEVGDAVGTLGFADELVALVACPIWGVLSDRIGVRTVCVLGYAIVGLALFLFVQAKNIYPQLLLARIFFSVGGAATATMVTAILPSMTTKYPATNSTRHEGSSQQTHIPTPSLSSELTITPERLGRGRKPTPVEQNMAPPEKAAPARLAGLVGMFTGCGALIALLLFLPIPARFEAGGTSPSQAVANSYYVVGTVALLVSVLCGLGLRNLAGEENKGWKSLLHKKSPRKDGESNSDDNDNNDGRGSKSEDFPLWRLLADSVSLGFKDTNIGLGYLGGFVARASSVGIALFIPLFVNAYFVSSGLCTGHGSSDEGGELKKNCAQAYVLAAEITGVSQLIALLCAPFIGFLSDRYPRGNIPLLVSALLGVVGYISFGFLKSPEPSGPHGTPAIFFIAALLGISQIGAIVCSLGLLGRGILGLLHHDAADEDGNEHTKQEAHRQQQATDSTNGTFQSPQPTEAQPSAAPRDSTVRDPNSAEPAEAITEETALLAAASTPPAGAADDSLSPEQQQEYQNQQKSHSRSHLKGSIAGTYSLVGGAGILLLTKLGGFLFDKVTPGAPFFMLAIFNGILLLVGAAAAVAHEIVRRQNRHSLRD